MGNDDYLLKLIDAGERDRARDYAAWLLGATGGYAIKVVNPGGVEAWKTPQRNLTALDEPLGSSRVTARGILETLTDAANTLKLPHAVHIHGNNLGMPGNAATTLESFQALEGRRAHFTHLQFHGYGTAAGGSRRRASRRMGQHAPRAQRGCGTGDVRPGDDRHRRRPGRVPALQVDRKEVVNSTSSWKPAAASCRWNTGRRPPSPRSSGRSAWSCSCSRRIPGGSSFDGPPERRVVPRVPAAHPALMDRTARDERLKLVNQKFLAGSALPMAWTGSSPWARSRSLPAPDPRGCSGCAQGAPRRRRRRRRHGLQPRG